MTIAVQCIMLRLLPFTEPFGSIVLPSTIGFLALIITTFFLFFVTVHKRQPHSNLCQVSAIPGCRRVGLHGRSNLANQFEGRNPVQQGSSSDLRTAIQSPYIQALFTYPVKSCRGVELNASHIETTGLRYDRLFTFARLVENKNSASRDETSVRAKKTYRWRFMTQREAPRLALLETELWIPDASSDAGCGDYGASKPNQNQEISLQLRDSHSSHPRIDDTFANNGGCIVLRFPSPPHHKSFPWHGRPKPYTIRIPLAPTPARQRSKSYTLEPLTIWKDTVQAWNLTSEIPAKTLANLQSFLRFDDNEGDDDGNGRPLALFRIDDAALRPVTRSLPPTQPRTFAIAMADAFPIHLLSVPSVAALDAAQPPSARTKNRLDARRFRANVYVAGCAAFDEDAWKRIRVEAEVLRERYAESNEGGTTMTEEEPEGDEGERGFHIACRTARCGIPNVDPETGRRDGGRELDATLRRTRRVDRGAWPYACLGMMMMPLGCDEAGRGPVLRVGQRVRVLERGEHVYEKMFP